MSNIVIRLPESLETRLVKKLVWNFTTSPTFAGHVIQCSLSTPMKKATEKSRETTICWCLANQFLFILQRLARPLVLKYNCISWSLYLVTYTLKITKLCFHILQRIYSTDKQKILFSFVNKYRDTTCQVLPLQLVQGKLSQGTNSYSVTLLL